MGATAGETGALAGLTGIVLMLVTPFAVLHRYAAACLQVQEEIRTGKTP